ncbi:hypothetical protein [Rhizobium sp. BK251]|uniref:hypothetical protein n=1 Tax=Rhizobium sp. BK251 TaxID=2512125 RepID=UPI00104FD9AC|nr:hypothetical protein [Rhizobium sp. BK251]TCL70628.1 DnaA-like protein [Rhizobium sp. BK251]
MNLRIETPTAYESHLTRMDGKTAMRLFVEQKCAERGVSFRDIVGPRRMRALIKIRHAIIFDVAVAFPKAGTSAIGRAFNRDHSTISKSISREASRRRVPAPETRWVYSYDVDQIIADVRSGMSMLAVAVMHRIDPATVARAVKAHAARQEAA